jgi:DNA primase
MSFAEQLKSSLDIVRVIGEDVALKRVGSGPRYMGRCPFHTEKTPSFSVHRERQIYKCFGCGEGGDVFSFVMKLHGLTFVEAMNLLAERAGIPVPQKRERHEPEAELRQAILVMHEIALEAFREHLYGAQGADARAYLAKRGVTPSLAAEFGLGLSDRSGSDLTRRLSKFPPAQLEHSGLVSPRQDGSFYDRFRGRLMFPIHNEQGKVIGFGGRAMQDGEEPKYLNSPETSLYRKSSVLYNIHRARNAIRKADRVVLVEGYMDVIGVYGAGVQHVVASCGTALTGQQVKLMRRHSENITVNFDPDVAGANATERSLQILLDEGMNVRVLELEGGLDPDEYVKAHGAARYGQRLEQASGYFLWLAERARRKFDMHSAEGRVAGFEFLLPAIRHIPDRIERAAVANEVAAYLGIERGLVLDEFRKSVSGKPAAPAAMVARPEVPVRERETIACLLSSRSARDLLIPKLRESASVSKYRTASLIDAISRLHEQNPEFTLPELEGRLDDRGRDLLSHLMFSSDSDDIHTEELAQRLVEHLAWQEFEVYIADLRSRIRQAERSGDLHEALRLTEEYNGLKSRPV